MSEVRERAEGARREQGLPTKVEDPSTLRRVASLVRQVDRKVA